MTADSISVIVDGAPVVYTLRSLRDDETDLSRWADFCAFCFGNKSDPPTKNYFKRHFFNDPRRDASAIHIIEFLGVGGKIEIASSMRVFLRTISNGRGGTIEAGGIGEVCTHPEHRRRGLSKMLLTKSISFMENCGLETSLLHAAAAVTPVYKKNGNYECTTSRWSLVKIDQSKLCGNCEGYSVRLANFPSDTKILMHLHRIYSEERYAGCIVRTELYWNKYLSKEIGNSLFVLMEGDAIVAWLSIRPRGGRFQLREFGMKKDIISAAKAISLLLHKACSDDNINFLLPTTVLDDIEGTDTYSSFVQWEDGVQEEDDIGWMYRVIAKKEDTPGMVEITKENEHLIWPADSF
uniref:N-acetyltransferase domain-containing protein n=1 Tax=Odontella aurita TaxID=265563 RepID=A0A7S4MSD4_9STRA|mmetsp:Transcript_2996/g.7805  ORF Transcript_2996/g.7805 Transcript_2996/m.7805 type:complete len:351 (+) Transcript_2996:85-1137(+)